MLLKLIVQEILSIEGDFTKDPGVLRLHLPTEFWRSAKIGQNVLEFILIWKIN